MGLSLFLPKIEAGEVRTVRNGDKVDKLAEMSRKGGLLPVLLGFEVGNITRFTLFSSVFPEN